MSIFICLYVYTCAIHKLKRLNNAIITESQPPLNYLSMLSMVSQDRFQFSAKILLGKLFRKMLCFGIGLKEYFNLSYTDIAKTDISTKLDQIGVPGYEAGGLENWGLIMYNPDLFDSNINDLSEEKVFEKIVLISHEIGHHWIGNLVTSKWWVQS